MTETMRASTPSISLKSIALPVQHGGWGFWLEPTLLGMFVAFSPVGVLLSLAALAVFLLHHPLIIAFKDVRRGKRYERTRWALRFSVLYGGAALMLALSAVILSVENLGHIPFLPALMLALPLAAVQLGYETRNQGRHLVAETAGAWTFALLAPACALQVGWSADAAMGLWALLAVRSLLSISYVRARLRLEKGKSVPQQSVLILHLAGLILLLGLALTRMLPFSACIGGLILLARAWLGLSERRKPTSAKSIGFREMVYGLWVIMCAVLGYALDV